MFSNTGFNREGYNRHRVNKDGLPKDNLASRLTYPACWTERIDVVLVECGTKCKKSPVIAR